MWNAEDAQESQWLSTELHKPGAADLITREEEVELARRARLGDDEARAKLIHANIRYAVSVARKYQGQGLPLSDLADEAVIALADAAIKFDERRGFKFISFATKRIEWRIWQALARQSRLVRIPENRSAELSRYRRAVKLLSRVYDRRPTDEEIAEVMECDVEDVRETKKSDFRVLSLDRPFDPDDEDGTMLAVLPDESEKPPDKDAFAELLRSNVDAVVGTLPPREEDVVRRYFGLPPYDEPMTLEEIGTLFGLTRERIRQIKEKALERLGSRGRGEKLWQVFERLKADKEPVS